MQVGEATHSSESDVADSANKVSNSLLIGQYAFDGSEQVSIPPDYFGLQLNEIISRETVEPTASINSADFVNYDSELYYKDRTFTENLTVTRNIGELAQASNTIKPAVIGDKIFLFDSTNTSIYVFDTIENTISAIPTTAPEIPYLVESYNGKIILIHSNTLYTFDPDTYEFVSESISFSISSVVQSGIIGNILYYFRDSKNVYKYNLETKSGWSSVYILNRSFYGSRFCLDSENNKAYIIGGYYSWETTGGTPYTTYTGDVRAIDLTDNSLKAKTKLPVSFYNGSCACVGGKIYTFGGAAGEVGTIRPGDITGNVYEYNISSDTTGDAGVDVAAATGISAAIKGESVYLFGGRNSRNSNLTEISLFSAGGYTYSYLSVYTKPATGIPEADLAADVQTSLGKADTALQSIPVATSSAIGGVKPVAKTDEMTQPVGIDENGALYTLASSTQLTSEIASSGQSTPSDNLVIGGLFLTDIS